VKGGGRVEAGGGLVEEDLLVVEEFGPDGDPPAFTAR